MKKTLFIFTTVFLCIIAVLFAMLKNAQIEQQNILKDNLIYEQYLNKPIYGTDIATLINKAVDNNEKNKIEKDENGMYMENDSNSIKIEIYISINNITYSMETIYMHGTEQFVQNFNSILFESSEIKYHTKTGKIAKILFKQIEE